ncbi:MAG: SDR family NAD(P)-dependent oxidoreductase [Bacteroidota bacterium]|jgi:short-subunit dehydrogenase
MKRKDGIVLITGASEGIGRATAAAFAAQGYDLLLLARGAERLQQLADSLVGTFGTDCRTLQADVRNSDELIHTITAALEGRQLAAAIVNAGIGLYGPFGRTDWNDIEQVLRTNFDGAIASARAVVPVLERQGHGSLILVSSTIGKRAVPFNAVYSATKQGLIGFADALRLELKPHRVHVGVVCPARTDTPFFERMKYSVPQTKRRKIPTNPPEMVAKAILRCMRSRKREIVVSGPGKIFAFVGYHFPRLTDYLLYHNVPRPTDA